MKDTLPLPNWLLVLTAIHDNRITLTNTKFDEDLTVTKLQKYISKEYNVDILFPNLHTYVRILEKNDLVKINKKFIRVTITLTNKGLETAKSVSVFYKKMRQR